MLEDDLVDELERVPRIFIWKITLPDRRNEASKGLEALLRLLHNVRHVQRTLYQYDNLRKKPWAALE